MYGTKGGESIQFQYIPYIWPLTASAAASMSLGIYTFLKQRGAKGAKSFILSMFVVTIWSSANALEMAGTDLPTKLFWANVQYFAYCYSPITFLALCMQFTGYDRWVKNRRILWLAVLPTIVLLLIWTDPLHGLMRYDMKVDYNGPFPVISKKYGPAFFIHPIYSHFLNITTCVLLIRAVFFKNTVYRKQAIALLVGLSLIVIPSIMYVFGFSPIKRFDITPVFFGPSGLIIAWSIFRFKLFDVVPVARATVIETMNVGVMVLDLLDRVLDINPAFENIIGVAAPRVSARRIDEVCAELPELAAACIDRSVTHTEFSKCSKELTKVYEVLFSPLIDKRGVLIGRLVAAYDITKKKQEQQAYFRQQWKLAVIEERERMARDMHDNLGQVLGFISLQAQGIRQELANAGVELVSHELDRLVNVAQSANSEIREYIRNARSEEAAQEDFITALKQNLMGFEQQTGLKTKLEIDSIYTWDELNPNIRLNILNIVKEALNNIRKHAEAGEAAVAFSFDNGLLCVTVEDDGKGFDMDQSYIGKNNKFGLSIMKERASEIGAQLDIKSTPGKGSRVVLSIPVRREIKSEDESNAGR